jgi:hypothetical protein
MALNLGSTVKSLKAFIELVEEDKYHCFKG